MNHSVNYPAINERGSVLTLVSAALLLALSQPVLARTDALPGGESAAGRVQDGINDARIGGVFQDYDAQRGMVKLSGVEYELSPDLRVQKSKLRDFYRGQAVYFKQNGVSAAGRNVVSSLEPKKK